MKRILILMLIALAFNTVQSQQLVFNDAPAWFVKPRQKPLVNFASFDQTINISSYTNVIPNDGIDDFAGINQAITDAIAATAGGTKKVRLVFNVPGQYHAKSTINTTTDFRQSFWIEAAKNLEIDGNGSELIIQEKYRGAFYIRNSENVIIKNFKIDYDTNPSIFPFTQGRITAVGPGNSFKMVVPNGYPTPSQATTGTTQNWAVLKDGIGDGRLKANTYDLYPNGQFTNAGAVAGGTLYNCTSTNESYVQQMDIGDWLVVQGRQNHTPVIYPSLSKQITFLNIEIYAGPAGGFHGSNNYEINIIRCKVIPKPGTDRVHSINADGVHIPGSFLGPWVQECEFRGFLDDTFNMRHQNADFSTVAADKISIGSSITPIVGDSIVIFNYETGFMLSKTRVIAVSGSTATLSGNHNSSGGTVKAYFASRSCNSLIVRNNLIHGSRGWGMITSATQGEISGNTFTNMSSGGIKLGNIPGWPGDPEGLAPSDIVVENNQITNCGFSRDAMVGDAEGAGIKVKLGYRVPGTCTSNGCKEESVADQLISNITIKNNNIKYNKTGVSLQNINCLTFENNTLEFTGQNIYQDEVIPQYIKNTTFCNGNPYQGISLQPDSLRLTQIGKTHKLLPTVVPIDATAALNWTSSNPEIVSVDNNGVVTALKEGVAEITVSIPATNISDVCIVTVAKATLSTPRIHFKFDEPQGATEVVNTGTDVDVFGVIKGSIVTPGVSDPQRGQVLQTNTSGNTNHIILFDAVDSYPGPIGGQARTFSFWMKAKTFRTYNDINYSGTGSGGFFVVEFDQYGQIRFFDGSTRCTSIDKITLDEWTHIAVVSPEGGKFQDVKIYLNGKLSTMQYSNPAYNPAINTGDMNFQIGSALDGFLSDWRYYDYALNDQEILNTFAPKAVQKIDVSPTLAYLKPGDNKQLLYTITPEDAANRLITWSSNNNSIARVDENGLITAVANGQTTITVTTLDGNHTSTCNVIVDSALITPTAISLNHTSNTLDVGTTLQLVATVTPTNAFDKSVIWTSSNTSVATVNSNGLVTATGNGTATITATTNSGDKTASCIITTTTRVTGVAVSPKAGILAINETLQLNAIIAPTTATNKTVTWSSSNPATFTVDANGLIKAVGNGTATITVKTNDGNFTDTCDVIVGTKVTGITVTPSIVSLNLLQTATLTANITPLNASIKTVTWSSDDNTIATVDANGKVTALGMGITNIKATSDSGNFVASCLVAVNNVAYNKTVTSSTEFNTNSTKAFVNDLNLTNEWKTYSWNDGWVIIDLGAVYYINQFALFPKNNTPYLYTIGINSDGSANFTTVVDRSTSSLATSPIIDNVIVSGRYVKLKINGDFNNQFANWFYINEFMIFGSIEPTFSNTDTYLDSKALVYPNPTNGMLNIRTDKPYYGTLATIVDISGRVLKNEHLYGKNNTIDLTSLSDGLYLMHLKDGDKLIETRKIMLKK